MANTTKVTKAMALNAIVSLLKTFGNDTKVGDVSLDDMNAYCENELALLAKKKSSTSKAAKANAETRMALAEIILATLDTDTKVDNISLDDMTAYCENELALLAKKKSSTSKAAKANAETRMALAEIILETLANAGKPMTVSEMQNATDALRVSADGSPISNQRITSVCYALVETSQLVNTKEKKKSYFSIA